MRESGRYSRVSNNVNDKVDLDQEINNFVDKQNQLIEEVKSITDTDSQERAILKAMLSEIVDNL